MGTGRHNANADDHRGDLPRGNRGRADSGLSEGKVEGSKNAREREADQARSTFRYLATDARSLARSGV